MLHLPLLFLQPDISCVKSQAFNRGILLFHIAPLTFLQNASVIR
jgi:hypothetical protein